MFFTCVVTVYIRKSFQTKLTKSTSTLMESIEIMKYDKSVFMVQEYCQELVQQNADATVV